MADAQLDNLLKMPANEGLRALDSDLKSGYLPDYLEDIAKGHVAHPSMNREIAKSLGSGVHYKNSLPRIMHHIGKDNPSLGDALMTNGVIHGWDANSHGSRGQYLQAISNQLNGFHPLSNINSGHFSGLNNIQRMLQDYHDIHSPEDKFRMKMQIKEAIQQSMAGRASHMTALKDMMNPQKNPYHNSVSKAFGRLQDASREAFANSGEGDYLFRGIGMSHAARIKNSAEQRAGRTNYRINSLNSYTPSPESAAAFGGSFLATHVNPEHVFLHHHVIPIFSNEDEVALHQGIKNRPNFLIHSNDSTERDRFGVYGHPKHFAEHSAKLHGLVNRLAQAKPFNEHGNAPVHETEAGPYYSLYNYASLLNLVWKLII